MSHIPASAMPHAKSHDDEPDGTTSSSEADAGSTASAGDAGPSASGTPGGGGTTGEVPLAALAIGGLLVVGVIAAAVLPFIRDADAKPAKKKGGKRKKDRAAA